MRHLVFTLSVLSIISILAVSVQAQTTPARSMAVPLPDSVDFGPGRYVLARGLPILTDNSYSIPDVCDWNGDGNKDMLVGVFSKGNIYLFLNQGTDENPIFGDGTLLAADGEPISVSYG